jgi:hypothetical protein
MGLTTTCSGLVKSNGKIHPMGSSKVASLTVPGLIRGNRKMPVI